MINARCLFTPSAKMKKCFTQIGIDLSPYSFNTFYYWLKH